MLTLINQYCHSYIVAPVVEACWRHGLFKLLCMDEFRERDWLIKEVKANSNYFVIALQVLEALGWIEKNSADAYRLCKEISSDTFKEEVFPLYNINFNQLVSNPESIRFIAKKIDEVFFKRSEDEAITNDFQEGAVILPLIMSLRDFNADKFCDDLNRLDDGSYNIIKKLFTQQGWLDADGRELTSVGRELLLADISDVIISCRPILSVIDDLLFSDQVSLLEKIRGEVVDGVLNQFDSFADGLKSRSCLEDFCREIIDIFDRKPVALQPHMVVDIGNDNDFFIEKLYRVIAHKTTRGDHLKEFPLRMIAINQDKNFLEDANKNLIASDRKGYSHYLNKYFEVDEFLAEEQVLYIHNFIDFDIFINSKETIDDSLNVIADDHPMHYLDQQGRLIDVLTVLNHWQKYLQAWAEQCSSKTHLLLLERHILPMELCSQYLHESERACFNAIQNILHQYLISAEALIVLAASVGLFNSSPVKRYPKESDFCRLSLHYLSKRDYIIRHASHKDLTRLYELEALCWQHTRTPKKKILTRLQQYPQGQFVLEKEGRVIGVIYSQRIEDAAALDHHNAGNVHELHQASGALIQLLAVNIDPQAQNLNYGDQLLEFMLQRCSLVAGVRQVVAVTLCKNYNDSEAQTFEQYIQQQGGNQDPVLAFHHAHGAYIVKAIANYRPQDKANKAYGVLVAYDIHHRVPLSERMKEVKSLQAGSQTLVSHRLISQFVQNKAEQLLSDNDCLFDADRPVMEMGLDSADLLKLQQQLEEKFSHKLQPGFFFEYNTINKVIAYLETLLITTAKDIEGAKVNVANDVQPDEMSDLEVESITKETVSAADIAIIGVSCKLPGGIETPDMFWQVLASGGSAIDSFPKSRGNWPTSDDWPGIAQGGFVRDADAFDAGFFRISPAEALITDPQQRFLLELTWSCLEDASILPETLKGTNTGVFIGASNCDYSRLIQDAHLEIAAHQGIGSSLAILANRLSYFFDLSGPSLLIDTACSSSLVALHTAMQSLHVGECSAALVGGVNLICHPDLSVAYHKAGMLSPDGKCKVFDADANGYVRSEGAVVMLLKPLTKAIEAHDQIHAVLKGSAVNHGGLASGLTVPNPKKQSELLMAAWKNAGISAEDLSCLELHGTGTSLGDPIEIQGIQTAYQKLGVTHNRKACSIASVKSNLGHLESAAGMTGLLKVILSMQHQMLPASINFKKINPKINLENSPFYVQQSLQQWNSKQLRMAGVSSFGSGGANAHIVVAEYLNKERVSYHENDYLFVLSAVDELRLQDYARKTLDWLRKTDIGDSFANAIYSWQIGRVAFKQRLAIRVSDQFDLQRKLELWLSGDESAQNIWFGQVESSDSNINRLWQGKLAQKIIDQALFEKDLSQLSIVWVSGVELDWSKLYANIKPHRMSVPTYAFARDRYWVDTRNVKRINKHSTSNILHPLLHINTSNFSQQSYMSTFSGEEFFLTDHRVNINGDTAQKILPGVAYLEMARAAIEQASPFQEKSMSLALHNIVWIKPIVVTEAKDVTIALYSDNDEKIDFEIYSIEQGSEIIHCQGQAAFANQSAIEKLDIALLKQQMPNGRADASTLYKAFSEMGLDYGHAHQSIALLHLGRRQLLASISLPTNIKSNFNDYILHPSQMDAALQACVALLVEISGNTVNAPLPFALDSLYIVSDCKEEMLAWVRESADARATNAIIKLDIDLCDTQGNVCIQIRGFSARTPTAEGDIKTSKNGTNASLLATPVWEYQPANDSPEIKGLKGSQHHIVLCEMSAFEIKQLEGLMPESHCLSLQAAAHKTIAERYSEYSLACFEKLQTILKGKPEGVIYFQVVTSRSGEQALLAGLSGFLKTAHLENPNFIGQLILTQANVSLTDLTQQLYQTRNRPQDSVVKYAQDGREVLRWQVIQPNKTSVEIKFKDQGIYLITGGLGGLGILFIKEIVKQTPMAKIILTGRSVLDTDKQLALDSLILEGAHLDYQQLDLDNLEEVSRLMLLIQEKYHQLNGIIHAAGMIADNFLIKKTSAEFSQVLTPKVNGTYNLDQASQKFDLDFFVLFSSIASSLGNLGQTDYAAANGFMDQFASYRNQLVAGGQRQGKTLSLNWPLWEAGGMKMDKQSQELLQRTTGMRAMQTATGLEVFYRGLELPGSQYMVMEGDLSKLEHALFVEQTIQAVSLDTIKASDKVEIIADDSEKLIEKTQDYISKQLSALIKLPTHKIDPRAALEEYGIDSILAMNLTNRLEETFGVLSKTLLFEYKTISELAEYFVKSYSAQLSKLFSLEGNVVSEQLKGLIPKPTVTRHFKREVSTSSIKSNADSIAIIGLSGRYPESVNIEEYWHNLQRGKDCITEVPKTRWDWQDYFSEDRNETGRHYSKWGGFISGVDEFDPRFFNISPREAKYIDPQERLMLQHAWMAIEDAGYTRASLQIPHEEDLPGQVGVYIGVMYSEYQLFGVEVAAQDQRMGFAGNLASIANRISYSFNLHGPSMTLDTMCSSSLTAIHTACQDLKQRRTDLAIAGGVNISIHPNKYLMLSVGQFISSDGHCQSFGEGGDGYIPGEGVGAVILKRFSDAKKDGDHIYAVIKGSALSHGGKTNGYTVPNPPAQTSAINRALAEANINPRHISYIEAHGTGTKLGDPIEISALSKAFNAHTYDSGFCLIGSAKSNIGHCESAAGIAGLTKILCQMKHAKIAPSLHSEILNPNIDFEKTPFIVNQTLIDWSRPVIEGKEIPRIAGISSFGAGGSNAHMILEEYQSPLENKVASLAMPTIVIPLSARTVEELKQKAFDLLSFINKEVQSNTKDAAIDLTNMAYTLQVGREAMEERLGIIVETLAQLTEKLSAYINDEQAIDNVYQGQVKRHKDTLSLFSLDDDLQETIEKWIAGRKLSKLVDLWTKGLHLDWSKLYDDFMPKRISLPTYPFSAERYWHDVKANKQVISSSTVLHPLLHENTSNFNQQSYRSTFHGRESFLLKDAISGQTMLSTTSYLEMARTAVERAVENQSNSSLKLYNIIWGEPVALHDGLPVTISLIENIKKRIEFEIYSLDKGEEVIHCQGHAVFEESITPKKVDIKSLKAELQQRQDSSDHDVSTIYHSDDQVLVEFNLSANTGKNQDDCILDPVLVDHSLQIAFDLLNRKSEDNKRRFFPLAVDSVCVIAPCIKDICICAWVRFSQRQDAAFPVRERGKLDIDLCDEQGNICIQVQGIQCYAESLDSLEVSVKQAGAKDTVLVPKEIPIFIPESRKNQLGAGNKNNFPAVTLEKPRNISLQVPAQHIVINPGSLKKVDSIKLVQESVDGLSNVNNSSDYPSVSLYDLGSGIFSIKMKEVNSDDTFAETWVAQFLQALSVAEEISSIKVLLLNGGEKIFLSGDGIAHNCAIEQSLYKKIAAFPYPVIAVMKGDALGAGFMLGAVCDFMICNLSGDYSFTQITCGPYPAQQEALFFKERFGELQAEDFLYTTVSSTGRSLLENGWTCPILPASEIENYAKTLALKLSGMPQISLSLLKKHLARDLLGVIENFIRNDAGFSLPEEVLAEVHEIISFSVEHLLLEIHERCILSIKITHAQKGYSAMALLENLSSVFERIKKYPGIKCIVVSSEYPGFIPDMEDAIQEDMILRFQDIFLELPIPIVAVLDSGAKGVAWLISQYCDYCIYAEESIYSTMGILSNPVLARQAILFFPYRLGDYLSKEILFAGGNYSGTELSYRFSNLRVVKETEAFSAAVTLAKSLIALPRSMLVSWKRDKTLSMATKALALSIDLESVQQQASEPSMNLTDTAPYLVALDSKVISATVHSNGIFWVKMEDREAKNMFSEALVSGIKEVFEHIERAENYKVVILSGYDNYFSSGGTKETLLAIQEGKAKFTDMKIYHLAMQCKLPVIAAIQGHAIGAGWSLGMFADFVFMSEESHYVSPYMSYGFTPGAGATMVFPDKIGYDLARETLLTAQEYLGSELKNKGLSIPVVPRQEIHSKAMALANNIAKLPRQQSIALKQQLTKHLHTRLESIYEYELEMHEKTFVGQTAALEKIQSKFVQTNTSKKVATHPDKKSIIPTGISAALSAITATLKEYLAQELLLQAEEIDEDMQFIDLGLDSITGVTWVRKINEKYNLSIEATKVYSYPTLTELSRYIKGELSVQDIVEPLEEKSMPSVQFSVVEDTTALTGVDVMPRHVMNKLTSWRKRQAQLKEKPKSSTLDESQCIAVIGMAGQFPQANNLEKFWENIATAKNCISEVPQTRWNIDDYYHEGDIITGKTNCKWMGALEEFDLFDPLFFNISPVEAENMDPQQRLFLQSCWHSIEDAGYSAQALSGSKCGVFVGCTNGDYHQLSLQQQLTAQGFTGSATSILAARTSYFLNLTGPCLSIDTACSSSLVAIANACDSLISGSSDLALAGGVYVMSTPEMHIKAAQAGMLSSDGKCFTFDQRANGFVPGEGVGVVMLKRLADAERDQDAIIGLIKGWGVNQDGKTNGITAPNPKSQTRLQREVYDKYQIDPSNIQLLETHGTGTKLGDPIEVEGLKESFKHYTQEKNYCALGSVKSNIGHCITAAGVSGFIKTMLAIKHKQLPPTINFENINEHISLADSPFFINNELKEWNLQDRNERQAAISSFGFSGTNTHIVVSEYSRPAYEKLVVIPVLENGCVIIPLSAKSTEQLMRKVHDLLGFLEKNSSTIDFLNMAYTLQLGREEMEQRVGFMVASVKHLIEKMSAYLSGSDIAGVYQGNINEHLAEMRTINQDDEMKESILEDWISHGKLSRLLDIWVKGVSLDWNRLYGEVKPKRINLPLYPFAKERYWVNALTESSLFGGPTPVSTLSRAMIHPLLHANTSDFFQQSYVANFNGEEFFLRDHQVSLTGEQKLKVFPGVAYLEMARIAIEKSIPFSQESSILELHNIVWAQPVVVKDGSRVSIVLLENDIDSEKINFEVYSNNIEDEGQSNPSLTEDSLHGQGVASFKKGAAPDRVNLDYLKKQMQQGMLASTTIYSRFSEMGLHYGPSHQALASINLGNSELLAKLELPDIIRSTENDYCLHPSMMDGALQASIGLMDPVNQGMKQAALPFALELLRIYSACKKEMLAWVRHSTEHHTESGIIKFDIDLLDLQGNICVEMRGFSTRILSEKAEISVSKKLLSTGRQESEHPFDDAYYQNIIERVLNCEISADEAAKLG